MGKKSDAVLRNEILTVESLPVYRFYKNHFIEMEETIMAGYYMNKNAQNNGRP